MDQYTVSENIKKMINFWKRSDWIDTPHPFKCFKLMHFQVVSFLSFETLGLNESSDKIASCHYLAKIWYFPSLLSQTQSISEKNKSHHVILIFI